MTTGVASLSELGRFLALALILPGFVLLWVSYLLFPGAIVGVEDSLPDDIGSGTRAVLHLSAFLVFALTITATTFSLEYGLLQRVKLVPEFDFGQLAVLEYNGKPVAQLTQQVGQAIMHYNIWSGSLLLLIIHLIYARAVAEAFVDNLVILFVVLLIGANFYVSRKFYSWSSAALQTIRAEETSGTSRRPHETAENESR